LRLNQSHQQKKALGKILGPFLYWFDFKNFKINLDPGSSPG
jgi:hypothetical protein